MTTSTVEPPVAAAEATGSLLAKDLFGCELRWREVGTPAVNECAEEVLSMVAHAVS